MPTTREFLRGAEAEQPARRAARAMMGRANGILFFIDSFLGLGGPKGRHPTYARKIRSKFRYFKPFFHIFSLTPSRENPLIKKGSLKTLILVFKKIFFLWRPKVTSGG
jgi:hypothetical protein